MRTPRAAAAFCALMLLGAPRGSAQTLPSFEELGLRVNLHDRLRVEDQSGDAVTGRLIRLTREEIAIQTDTGERRFTADTVREVAVRSHSLRTGALVGTGVFAALGALAICSHEGGGTCLIRGSLGAAPVGAGLGAAAGSIVSGMKTVYRAPAARAPSPPARSSVDGHTSLLEDLGLRVNLDDRLRVEQTSGVTTTGRLTRLTPEELTIRTGAGERRIARETLYRVAVRRRPLRTAVLIGAGAGAALGALTACTGADREECADAPILLGGTGAGLGLAAGALLDRKTVVYPEARVRASMIPLLSRGVAGVQVGLRW